MARARRWVAPLLFAVLLTAFAAGIWGMYRANFPGKGLYRASGVYEARYGDVMLIVRHEKRKLVEQLTHNTSPGHLAGGNARQETGLPGGGPRLPRRGHLRAPGGG